MFKTYLKTAWRQLKKNKGYALLNMAGLALGMACAILILLWVNDEWQYDRFHKNHKYLYQFLENQHYDNKTFTFPAMPGPFAPAAKQEIPEIKYITRTTWENQELFSLDDKNIYETGYFVDPDFLKMFSFPLLKGNPETVLTDPTSILITDEMAEKFFGKTDAMGKTLMVNKDKSFTIVGIVKKPPLSSSIRFSWLASFKVHEERNKWLKEWTSNGIKTYCQLKENADPVKVNKKLLNFIQSKNKEAAAHPFLFSINDWRLRDSFEEGKQTGGGRIEYVRIFSIVALFIIIIACINFMNLATARSEQRAREVGVRKVMGAGRGLLIRQFFSESVFTAFASMVIASLIVLAVLSPFNTLVEKKLVFDFTNPVVWVGLPLIALLCGVVAGSYPSLYLSSFNPTTVFRGLRVGKNSIITYIRKGLVVTQFVVSIALIICTIIIYRQVQHVKERPLGYSKDNIIMAELRGDARKHFETIRNDLLATGLVENATKCNNRVIELGSSSGDFEWEGKDPTKELLVTIEWTDPHYVSTMHMRMAAGRDFHPDGISDSNNVIINETFAGLIGKKDPVGQIIRRDGGKGRALTVVGVVKDFVFNDMYRKPEPLLIFCEAKSGYVAMIRLKNNKDIPGSVSKVEAVMKKNNPGYPLEYQFFDEEFNNMFRSEALIGKLSRLFALLTILISCLGLFGLAAFTAERRTKEIGIRKVLGASLANVITLLSKDFLQLVALASLVAFPLAWWLMYKWLQDYPYRIAIQWWIFAVAGALAVFIALFTVSFQAIKAGLMNPVKSLRTE